jgi:hypothetical protein
MRVLLVALAAASALTMLAGTAASLWRMRSDALESTATHLADLSVVLAEQTDRAVDQIDFVLQGAVEEATRAATTAPVAPVQALHEALAAQLRSARAPQLGALGLVGADGGLVTFSGAFPPPKLDYGDRDHFRAHRDGAPTRLFIGAPQRARLLQDELGVPLSKRIERPGGAFAGTAFALARLPYFVDLYSALKLGPGSAVRLYRRDGVLLASFPPEEGTAGRSFADSASFREVPPEGSTAVVREGGPDGSIVAMRALVEYPLVVAVSVPEAQVLAAWRRDAWIFGALAGLAAAFVLGLVLAVERRLAADARLRGELREGTARLDAIVQSAMDAMITVDSEQRIVLFNNAAERMFGVEARQAIGTSLERFIPERFRAAHRDHIERFGRTGETSRRMGQQQALWGLRADGTEFRIEASISHAAVSGQQLFTVILRDITERLATEARVREGEARLEAIVQSATDAIITVNAAQRIVLFNRAAERTFGVVASQALGAPLANFVPERFRAGHREHVDRFGRTGETARRMGPHRALHALHADGTEFPIEASISHATVGGEQLFSVIIRDITARLAAAAEIERSHAQLRELGAVMHEVREAEQTRIARELHDELGQALTALKMDVELLESLAPPDRADLLERTGAMRGLLDSTVQTTRRISADLRPLVLDDLGLAAAIEWLVDQLRQRARVDCDLVMDSSLADLPEPYASAIFRVMQESLTNVVKHARASRVELQLAREGGSAVLTVRDDGVGMGQADQAKPRSFGLRGIRERILGLGGEVRIVSQPGGGTIVVVRVPLGDAPGREAA